MQGIGNDFVVVTAQSVAERDPVALAVALCKRRFGAGADGLLVVGRGTETALTFRMFNPDGSEDMCGNGLRCACLWAVQRRILPISTTPFLVRGFDGDRACRIVDISGDRKHALVTVDMGAADFSPVAIPFTGPNEGSVHSYALPIGDEVISISSVSTGSTHSIIFVDSEPDDATFQRISPLIENHPYFPERTSVMWTWPDGANAYRIRIWERAAGETLGCGTGATAVAAVAWNEGKVDAHEAVAVRSKGGELTLKRTASRAILMTGPAVWVYEGVWPEQYRFAR